MPRKAKIVEIPAIGELDRAAGHLSRQLAQALRKAIGKGELKAGDLLPSTRVLAGALQLARGTVIEAFEQLVAEGFFVSQPGSGTRVAPSLNVNTQPAAKPAAGESMPLSRQAEAFSRAGSQFTTLPAVPFAVSVPAGSTAPDDVWRRLGNRIRARGPGAPSGYGDPQGARPLREVIAEYVRKSRSVHCTPDQVIITAGTQQGLYLAAQILPDAGEAVWVEDPAYSGITAIFATACRDKQMIRVPVDAEGIDVEAGRRLAENARAAFVTPSHQYPLGMPMSMARRTALLAWAREQRAWVVEDDYDSELRYAGHPFPSLQGLDPVRVVYLGTFSKILFPSLRLGYAIVPDRLVDAFCGARQLMDRHPPSADQYVLASFMAEGHLDRHIRRMRTVYADRREVLINAIRRTIPPALARLQPCDQGMHMVLWLNAALDDRLVAREAGQRGVSLRAVSPMYGAGNARSGLILGLGGFSDQQIENAVQQLYLALVAVSRIA
ncbi:PLP-dependent aminotransferase family protein [Pantoea sp. B65]|uniref:MocR-like pyridoxine biosynthesis transcription factor PdxR n=1 Tax=Pantoea sp. B65 TaxID=2813359 RepID=UPI0039B57DF3